MDAKNCISICITNIGPTRRTWTLGNKVNSTDPNVGLYGGPVGRARTVEHCVQRYMELQTSWTKLHNPRSQRS